MLVRVCTSVTTRFVEGNVYVHTCDHTHGYVGTFVYVTVQDAGRYVHLACTYIQDSVQDGHQWLAQPVSVQSD